MRCKVINNITNANKKDIISSKRFVFFKYIPSVCVYLSVLYYSSEMNFIISCKTDGTKA